MKKTKWIMVGVLFSLAFAGCGEKEVVSDSGTATTEVGGTVETTVDTTVEETVPHEHIYVYETNADGTHNIVCSGENCDYAEAEACVLDENYECTNCGYKHAHVNSVSANNDGTHTVACTGCDYTESAACTPDESYTCTECGWIQEHDCVYEHYECQICGTAYPWEQDIKYFDETLYYAQKELNIYKYPDLESEVIGTLYVDEEVSLVGSISVDKKIYRVTKDGGCIPDNYNLNANRWDLREAKTSQVIVTYMTLSGDTWSALKLHGVYDSYDAALLDLCGSSWSHIKANWTYNDYKSQGLSFMNSYAEGASGKTVTTRNQADPYSYSVADGTIAYYFQ